METKFQTSFIPKKPLMAQETARVHAPTSIFMVIGVFGAAAFMFVAKDFLLKAQEKAKTDLADNEKRFDLPLIEELKKANTKIDVATQLLRNHAAVSEAFRILSALTAEKVRFTSFELLAPDSNPIPNMPSSGNYKIRMKGVADSFNTIAFQSDVFSRSQKYGTNKIIKNPVLSDLVVTEGGAVAFFFSTELVPPDLSYAKTLGGDTEVAAPAVTPTRNP